MKTFELQMKLYNKITSMLYGIYYVSEMAAVSFYRVDGCIDVLMPYA